MPTREECKKIISNMGWLCGVSPKLIATRLLSEDDKQDMLNGDLPAEALECAVKVWIENGMPDYANGNTDPMKKNF
jgi:uncharacterized protein YaeQ